MTPEVAESIPQSALLAQSRTALTPQEYREEHRGVPGFSMVATVVRVVLQPDPWRARYHFECLVEGEGSGFAAHEWAFLVPCEEGAITDVHASDGEGTLQTSLARDGNRMRLGIRFRAPVTRGVQYRFAWSYETSVMAIVSRGSFWQTVAFCDWVAFDIYCDLLRLSIELPAGGAVVGTVPVTRQRAGETGAHRVCYEVRDLRPLEAFTYLVGYRKKKVGPPFYRWLVSAIGSGLVGALIAAALGFG